MEGLTRKKAAEQLGIGAEALRYYEREGLISPPSRSENGYRLYNRQELASLEHILRLKSFGFSLAEIKAFIRRGDYRKDTVKAAVRQKIDDIERAIADHQARLDNLLELLRMIETT